MLFRSPESASHRAIVLLSDGEDHGGHLERAVAALRRAGIAVAAIGIGTRHGGPIGLADGSYKRDAGEVVITRLHPEVLEQLANGTGGIYLQAHDARFDPEPVVDRLSAISGRKLEQTSVEELEERFQWPLALAALALGLSLLLTPWRRAPAPGEAV